MQTEPNSWVAPRSFFSNFHHRHHAPFQAIRTKKVEWTPIIVRRVTVRKRGCLLRIPSIPSVPPTDSILVFPFSDIVADGAWLVAWLSSFLFGTDTTIRANLHLSEVQLNKGGS